MKRLLAERFEKEFEPHSIANIHLSSGPWRTRPLSSHWRRECVDGLAGAFTVGSWRVNEKPSGAHPEGWSLAWWPRLQSAGDPAEAAWVLASRCGPRADIQPASGGRPLASSRELITGVLQLRTAGTIAEHRRAVNPILGRARVIESGWRIINCEGRGVRRLNADPRAQLNRKGSACFVNPPKPHPEGLRLASCSQGPEAPPGPRSRSGTTGRSSSCSPASRS